MALRTERSTKECDKDMEKGVSIRASGTRWRGGEREISGRILYELRNRLSGFEIFALGFGDDQRCWPSTQYSLCRCEQFCCPCLPPCSLDRPGRRPP